MKTINKPIIIKRRIYVDNDIREFIFENINYRRRVYNDFVEESRNYDSVFKFNPIKFKSEYFNDVEKLLHIYDDYCVGISEQVAKDIAIGIKTMKRNKHFNSKLKFKTFDQYYGTFKVNLKPMYYKIKNGEIHFDSRLKIKTKDKLKFRIRKGDWLELNLKESLFVECIDDIFINTKQKYYFTLNDIKEISFIHDMGRFYISLSVYANYIIDNPDKISYAGIDLGIRNPITLYCKNGIIQSNFKMSNDVLNRIEYLERRVKKLQSIMDRKYRENGNIYSNNYEKVRKKYLITQRKIYNIKLDWRRKTTLKLARMFDIVVVDNFYIPNSDEHKRNKITSKKLIRKFNNSNRRYCMSYTYKLLIHNIEKLGGAVIEAPSNTTSTCSKCGHKNKPLPLYETNLTCEKCGEVIDRDINAAVNCYNYITSSF